MEDEKEWKRIALERQWEFFETLGSRPYDEIEKSDLFLLKKKVGFATCGKPSELPNSSNYNTGYKKEHLDNINSICKKIVETSDYDPIRFACTILILYHEEICETAVFRIVTESGNIFIDVNARVYQSWNCFMENNELPGCEYCYPLDGEYSADREKLVGFAMTPACGMVHQTSAFLDTARSVASVAASSIFTAGMFITVAPAVAMAAGAAVAVAGIAKLAGLHTLTPSSLVFNGFGFVKSIILYLFTDKHNKGTLTKQDVFDLSCELLFLFNATASAKATTDLVHSMSAVATLEAPSGQRKLTRTQKRNLGKRVAKSRAKGLSPQVHEETSITSGLNLANLQLLFEAMIEYAPRVEEIIYRCQSIGHDIMCWNTKEISTDTLMRNLAKKLMQLYIDYKEDIADAFKKIMKYLDKDKSYMSGFVEKSSQDLKSSFCTKVINMEDQLDVLINDADRDIITLQEQLEIENSETTSESIEEEEDNEKLDDDLSPEAQHLLSSCEKVIAASSLQCMDLQDFGDILDVITFEVVNEFKEKVANYKKSLEECKLASKESFDINAFNEAYEIKGNVGQHFFKETLQSLTSKRILYKIKNKCKDINRERCSLTTSLWGGLREGMFQYFGPHGAGELSKRDLLSVISCVTKTTVTEKNCKILEDKPVIMIEVDDKKNNIFIEIVLYCTITEENTASIMIMIMN